MIRRPLWLGAGVAIGVGGTLWAEQQVRRRVRRLAVALTPAGAADEVRRTAQLAGDRVRSAVDEARLERRRREAELWADLERPQRRQQSQPSQLPPQPRGAVRQHR